MAAALFSRALVVLLVFAIIGAAAAASSSSSAAPAHGGSKGKGANVADVCAATKSAWASTSACTRFQDGLCETVAGW